MTEVTAVTAEREAAEVDASMIGEEEEDIATRGHLLRRGFATTDTEALLRRAELTATFQAAHTETTLLPAGAARPPTIARAAALTVLPQGAAAATPPAPHALPPRLARPADAATIDPHPEMPSTAKTTTPRAGAKASAVTNTADPVRVLLSSVAHDLPEDPTTPAAGGRPPTTADPLLRRNAAARHRRPSLDRRLAGAAMSQARAHAHAHRRGVAKEEMTRMSCPVRIDMTRVGSAKVMQAGAEVAVVVAAAVATSHLRRSPNLWTRTNKARSHRVRLRSTIHVGKLESSSYSVLAEDHVKPFQQYIYPSKSASTCIPHSCPVVAEIGIDLDQETRVHLSILRLLMHINKVCG
jgi:hypothetical protein